MEYVQKLNHEAMDGLWPDVTFVLDLDVEKSKERMQSMGKALDRLESEDDEFKESLRQGYYQLQQIHPKRIVLLDADLEALALHELICRRLELS